jgi:type II secretory pathway pseudopilin PulG
VSLLEVLFAILVTTVGLLGAIAIFPVASSRARQARINDAAAMAGRSAVHAFDTRGMRRPDRWYAWNPALNPPQFVNKFTLGQAYCIDSRFLVRNTGYITAANRAFYPELFPYASPLNPLGAPPLPRMERIAFFPGTLDQPPPPTPPNFLRDQFDRRNLLTFVGGQPAYGRNLLLADSIFVFEDDLAFVRPGRDEVAGLGLPADRALPAIQLFDPLAAGGGPGQRSTGGRFSWMATLVPKTEPNAPSDEYVLSVVVFHDRPNDLYLTPYSTGGNENLLERVVNVAFNVPTLLSNDGTSGGEVLLYVPTSTIPTGPLTPQDFATSRLKLRAGDWILLGGRTQTILGTTPYATSCFQWYRVAQVDPEVVYAPAGLGLPDRYERHATLVGRDWNTSASSQYAALIEGVVGVYEKTIRLEYGSTY